MPCDIHVRDQELHKSKDQPRGKVRRGERRDRPIKISSPPSVSTHRKSHQHQTRIEFVSSLDGSIDDIIRRNPKETAGEEHNDKVGIDLDLNPDRSSSGCYRFGASWTHYSLSTAFERRDRISDRKGMSPPKSLGISEGSYTFENRPQKSGGRCIAKCV